MAPSLPRDASATEEAVESDFLCFCERAASPMSPQSFPTASKSVLMALGCTMLVALTMLASDSQHSPPGPIIRNLQDEPDQPFSFDAPFGSNMVLQYGKNTQAAIYGFLGPTCQGVELHLYQATPDDPFAELVFGTEEASINATQQPFNRDDSDTTWGPRPCLEENCPNYEVQYDDFDRLPFNPWNRPLPTWKVLLPPQEQPGGTYTVVAMCLDGTEEVDDAITLYNVTYGDVWYCSGQSNMQLALRNTFHRQELYEAILEEGKYHNIRIMAGESDNRVYYTPWGEWNWASYGSEDGSNPWMTSLQAVDPDNMTASRLFQFGATCWYFAHYLTDLGVDYPIGLINTAIGGRRIQEFMDNRTISQCHKRAQPQYGNQEPVSFWVSQLFASQVLPFVDLTIKGFLWYQGENNMLEIKGNSFYGVGYGCEIKTMIASWRKTWSLVPNTTSPFAPFGTVVLAKDGHEDGPDFGTMRHAQTANYGVLPPLHHPVYGDDVDFLIEEKEIGLANTFLAQAYDLPDEWNAGQGPCFDHECCDFPSDGVYYNPAACRNKTLYKLCHSDKGACTITNENPYYMGTIHPRSKREVGQRLATAAYNLFFGGTEAYTGPTLTGCSVREEARVLEIRFNETLLRGDTLAEPQYPSKVKLKFNTYQYNEGRTATAGGSHLYVQTNASQFCMEEFVINPKGKYICPEWAGGSSKGGIPQKVPFTHGWIEVPIALKNGHTILADLSGLPEGQNVTAVRYAWGDIDCCDHQDPELFVTKGCIANCPLMSKNGKLPANPFKARIVNAECECIAPQKCSDKDDNSEDGID